MALVKALAEKPMNANELAKRLGVDYKTVRHHLDVLMEHGLVERLGDGYGAVYTISAFLKKYWKLLE